MEQVILVDENDVATGSMEKMEAHRKGVLHRAFSIFIFNRQGDMLIQQRSPEKYHSAGLWSNACCSHPRPGETTDAAASRRLREEMGFTTSLHKIFDFLYQAGFENGLTEYEFDHVYVGRYDGNIAAPESEVAGYRYIPMTELRDLMNARPRLFTAWFHIAFPQVYSWWEHHGGY